MNKSEITDQIEWDANDLGNLSLFVPLFGMEVPFVLFTQYGTTPELTDKMMATINDVLALEPGNLSRVKELLWEECNFSFQVADYGVEMEPGETSLQAHFREFGISNPDNAYEKSSIKEIHISDEFEERYAQIKVDTGANNYISIIVKNGRIIDFDDDGTHLGWFDRDEQHAHKKRQKVIG